MNKWVRPSVYDQDALADQILLEQFLGDLEDCIQHWVWWHLPQNCKEALRLAKAFAISEGEYGQEWPTSRPGSSSSREGDKSWPLSKVRPRETVYFWCCKMGHFSKDCQGGSVER